MSAPHADRDHSEQPTQPEAFVELLPPDVGHNLRHLGPERAHVTGEECHCSPERIPHPTQGTSRSVSAREVRASEAQQVAAMDALDCGAYQNRRGVVVCVNEHHEHHGPWTERGCPVAAAVADAVAAGPDADEVTRLRAELKRLGREVAKVARERSAAESRAESWEQVADDYNAEIVAAHAERDRLAEVVARVEALAASEGVWKGKAHVRVTERLNGYTKTRSAIWVDDLRAALSGPTPAETPQNGPEPALSREHGTSGQSGEGEALRGAEKRAPSIGDTCCGKCPGGTCYVDGVTGA